MHVGIRCLTRRLVRTELNDTYFYDNIACRHKARLSILISTYHIDSSLGNERRSHGNGTPRVSLYR